jgi:protein-S-isoprenylcysteine O-methyltransferase Ste14
MKTRLRIIGLALLLCCGIAFFLWQYKPSTWTWMQTLGLVMMLVGFSLWLVAHIQLGSSFSVSAQARTLVTHGLYSKIRSPIYVFGSIGIAGAILFSSRPAWLLILVVLIPVQIMRARNEARVLEAKFDDQYREYRCKTWI